MEQTAEDNYTVDDSEQKEFKLPPHPRGVRDWTDKDLRYTGDTYDFRKRIIHKIYNLWVTWATIVMDENINKKLAEECDKESPLFEARCTIIDIMDQIGKGLADTDILEELAWLSATDEEDFLEKAKEKRRLSAENERNHSQ
jgi:hypothetical protein